MSKKNKNVCATLPYIEHFLYSLFHFSTFASLIVFRIGMKSNTLELEIVKD